MSNPILPRTNATPGAGAPASLYLAEVASNRSTGTLYLGCDSGVEVVGERVTSIARGGTASTTAEAALTALGAAPLASPAFTGTPTAPTATAGTNSTQIATTAFVQSNRGDKYLTTSATTWTLANGTQAFTVDAGLSYTPTQDVTIVYDANNHAHGSVVSYSGTTLTVDIHQHSGSGTYSAWTLNVGGLSTANGALLQANNLSDVANPATALANIGGVSTSAIIDIAHGGTAATTQQAALNSIVGAITANCVVSGDGTNVTLRPLTNADIPLLSLSKLEQGGATTSQVLGYTVSGWAPKTLTTSDISGFTAGGVTSVAGRTGAVTLTTADIGGLSSSYVANAGNASAIRVLTQAQYNALTPDASTIYIITA